ncbi:NIF family HAD-type phosphatase [Nitrincola sp.]|uniref:NIF family HAD-type phosphatase n=1 Tax=Nitrincola sp. TaxID=1926584 RepID=UPI003A9079FE
MNRPLLCLDLEGTLISNAVSQIPRPGLHEFLSTVGEMCDLLIYTSVSEERVTSIQSLLVAEGVVPEWFADLAVMVSTGNLKPKSCCGRDRAFLLDDQPSVIVPGEESWWIAIPEYLPPYSETDQAFKAVLDVISQRVL